VQLLGSFPLIPRALNISSFQVFLQHLVIFHTCAKKSSVHFPDLTQSRRVWKRFIKGCISPVGIGVNLGFSVLFSSLI